MDYNVSFFKEKLKGTIHMAPVAYNFKYVQRPELAERYGLKPFHRTLHDIGSEFTADLTWILSDMIKWRTRYMATQLISVQNLNGKILYHPIQQIHFN